MKLQILFPAENRASDLPYAKEFRQPPFRDVRWSEHTRCWSDFDVVRNSLSVSDADRSEEIPYRYQGCFIVVLVECLCIFSDVVIPKIISLLFPIICRRSRMSLHKKDRGYSFYDAMNSRLSFMYFSRNGGIRDVVHSVVTFFFSVERNIFSTSCTCRLQLRVLNVMFFSSVMAVYRQKLQVIQAPCFFAQNSFVITGKTLALFTVWTE